MLIGTRRTNREQKPVTPKTMAIIFAAGLLAFVLTNMRYFYNCIAGPFALSDRDLLKISNPESSMRYYVTVHGGKAITTPFLWEEKVHRLSTKDKSTRITAFFLLLPTKAGLLLVKTPALTVHDPADTARLIKTPEDTGHDSYTGELAPMDHKLQMKVKERLELAQRGLGKKLLPYVLQHTDRFKSNLLVCFLAVSFLATGLAYFIIKALLSGTGKQPGEALES